MPAQQPALDQKAVFGDPNLLPHGEANLTPLAQLKRMQRTLYAMTQEEGVDRREAAAVACAWERLEARKAVLCGKPGSITSKAEPPSKKVNRATRRPHDNPDEASAPAQVQPVPVTPQSVVLPPHEAGSAT